MTRARLAIGASVAAIVLFVAFGAALLNAPGLLPAPDLPDAIPTVDSRVREVLRSDAAERTIREAIESGASCAQLFETRNALDPDILGIETINANLRKLGCHSSGSVRSK